VNRLVNAHLLNFARMAQLCNSWGASAVMPKKG
jgi:hypothetical protein